MTMTTEVNAAMNGVPRLLILGTGAGDWPKTVPEEEIQYTGNRDYRRFCAALVNDNILIDCGPTLLNSLDVFQVDANRITDLLITHTHWDHLNLESLRGLAARRTNAAPLRMWGHATAIGHLEPIEGIEVHCVLVGTPFNIDTWTIEPLRANHWVAETAEQPLLYLFNGADFQWLYGTDTSWFPTPTYWRLVETRLSVVVIDATYGESLGLPATFGHNSLPMLRLIVASMRRENPLQPNSRVYLTHLAKNWHPPHAELEQTTMVDNLIPAYDGMVLPLGWQ
jgi:phosphoribosyl 1,2-cyclic phosphodiesterase